MATVTAKEDVGQARIAARLGGLREALGHLAARAGAIGQLALDVSETLKQGGTIFLAGNGGSAAMAQHFATEFVVKLQLILRQPLPAISLASDPSVITAAANDIGFEYIFARQIEALSKPGDLLWLMSVGGISPNLLRAVEAARKADMKVVALIGAAGGPLGAQVMSSLCVPSTDSSHVQEMHLAIGHIVVAEVERALGVA